ncbi:cytochrome c [Pedobacter miscanthi]|jgi:mono/diheme cytochrome c family protein|uniref:c-type cytochrome n=1 Tax=Pedobacter miscanthi TaxID=2259170 RepID=UPI00292F166F|nr:cytochrome c [Pedobacter miscanthi]
MNKKTVLILACPVMLLLMSLKTAFVPIQVQLPLTDSLKRPAKFGFGRPATAQEIAVWDIDVRPDGKGLPAGQGDVKKGRVLYAQKCAMCHGVDGTEKPGLKLPGNALVGDTSATSKPKTIGNYWPYATTLFDYMRRAMPYNLPGSLSNDEVYSITAYLLNANKIIKADVVLDAKNLHKVVMPAKKLFIMDDRKGGPEIK